MKPPGAVKTSNHKGRHANSTDVITKLLLKLVARGEWHLIPSETGTTPFGWFPLLCQQYALPRGRNGNFGSHVGSVRVLEYHPVG